MKVGKRLCRRVIDFCPCSVEDGRRIGRFHLSLHGGCPHHGNSQENAPHIVAPQIPAVAFLVAHVVGRSVDDLCAVITHAAIAKQFSMMDGGSLCQWW